MRWGIRLDREAVKELYQIERTLVSSVWSALDALAENPDRANFQSDSDNPSLYWLAIDGDIMIFFEIIDEDHAILVVSIK